MGGSKTRDRTQDPADKFHINDIHPGTLRCLGPRKSGGQVIIGHMKGFCLDLPEVGSRFRIFQGSQYVDTSIVQRVDGLITGSILITTENSVYTWTGEDK